jgi:23S rRNA (adenine2503-C2)-methyltransferase
MLSFPQSDQNGFPVGEEDAKSLFGIQIQRLASICESFGLSKYRARQLFHAFYRQRISSLEELTTLPQSALNQFAEAGYFLGLPIIAQTFQSVDGTERYLIACEDGETVETVWMPNGDNGEMGDGSEAAAEEEESFQSVIPIKGQRSGGTCVSPAQHKTPLQHDSSDLGTPFFAPLAKGGINSIPMRRATICVSSQVGCAVNCQFCLTAKLGIKRNLTPGEIAGQVVAVLNRHRVHIGRDRINLVFMGMGEPFLNYDNFMAAVHLLVEGVGIPESRMTVSTSGILPGIERFAQEKIRPKLALSLNAPNDAIREAIMPVTRKWNIEALLAALREIPFRPRQYITFEYVLLGGINDRSQDARELAALLRNSGLPGKVNLIAWNPGPGIPYNMPAPEDVAAFQQHLIASGIPTFVRKPRGRDIYAACGQLKRTQE